MLVLARTTDSDDQVWLQVRLPIRPNGTTGWVQESALSELQPVDHLAEDHHQDLQGDRDQERQDACSARRSASASRSGPRRKGQFYVRAKLTGYKDPVYGPLAFVTSATSDTLTDWPGGGIVGVHGTNQPGLIPGRISHGCVRMKNADILKLNKLIGVGTPITDHLMPWAGRNRFAGSTSPLMRRSRGRFAP